MDHRERMLWTAIRRGLMLIISAIDAYLKDTEEGRER